MHFGKQITEAQQESWGPYYLDYNSLKDMLESLSNKHEAEAGSMDLSLASRFTVLRLQQHQHPLTLEFLHQLEHEIEKVMLFYVQEQGRIAYELSECRQAQWRHQDSLESVLFRYCEAAAHLLKLMQFVELNVTAIRKILKKHDKLLPTKLSAAFFAAARKSTSSCRTMTVAPLLQEDCLGSLQTVLESGIQEVQYWVEAERMEDTVTSPLMTLDASEPVAPAPGRRHIRTQTAPTLPSVQQSILHQRSLTPSNKWMPGTIQSQGRKSYQTLSQRENIKDDKARNLVWQIQAARRRLKQTNEVVHFLSAPLLMEGGEMTPDDEASQLEEELEMLDEQRPSAFSNFLNLMSTFLYMTNYYIVAPTSGSYAKKLGGSESLSSIIIGMTPVAALASTILYSWWTSHSYKAALIFASTCSAIGNLLYATGLPCSSLTLVMLGRLLNGFGSARSINRRYIADTYPREERTAASAAFVSAGALGMAAGPALSSVLHIWTKHSPPPNKFWQDENAPGWLMFVAWTSYLICLVQFFQDPPKRKRHEKPVIEMIGEEHKPLLNLNGGQASNNDSNHDDTNSKPICLNIPVMLTFVIYFVLKLVLEGILSSSSTLTAFYFDWDSNVCGIFLAALGCLMLPANLAVAYLARQQNYDDRELIVVLQWGMLFGCLIVMNYNRTQGEYTIFQYITGAVAIFVSSNALEGPNMSLLSKTIPKSWSRGIFNVGLLATEAGTLGRAVGDVFLAMCGSDGSENMLNRTFGTFSIFSAITLGFSYLYYDHLEPKDKDD